jgi:hypothetical protein
MSAPHVRLPAVWLVALALCASQPGCALVVMAGKMFFGDPTLKSTFRVRTGVDLVKSGKKVLVTTSTPQRIKSAMPSVDQDLTEAIVRRLRLHGIKVVDPDEVGQWIDEHGTWTDPAELAKDFDADYVIHVDLDVFDYLEENSPNLFRGRVDGHVVGHEIVREKKKVRSAVVFDSEFSSTYPTNRPVSVEEMSGDTFRMKYLDRLSLQLSHLLYDHRASEEVE